MGYTYANAKGIELARPRTRRGLVRIIALAVSIACFLSWSGSRLFGERSAVAPFEPKAHPLWEQVGIASWYGPGFHGRETASGTVYDRFGLSCAHRTLPLGAIVKVEVLGTGASLILEVTDRGPYVPGRVLDLSEGAAQQLGVHDQGLAKVRITELAAPK